MLFIFHVMDRVYCFLICLYYCGGKYNRIIYFTDLLCIIR